MQLVLPCKSFHVLYRYKIQFVLPCKMFQVLNRHKGIKINAYTGRKLGSFFHVKDKTDAQHKFDLVYKVCSAPTCNDTYIGEVERRLMERIKDHSGRDKNSHLVKHSIETGHSSVTINVIK